MFAVCKLGTNVKFFKLYNLYFMLVFNFIMCFLEKDDKTSCSKTEIEEG